VKKSKERAIGGEEKEKMSAVEKNMVCPCILNSHDSGPCGVNIEEGGEERSRGD